MRCDGYVTWWWKLLLKSRTCTGFHTRTQNLSHLILITQIMVYQRKRWIHSGHGFISSFDALWSEWSWITDHWSWSQRNAPLLNVSLYYFRFKDSGEVCKMTIVEIKTYRKKVFLMQQPVLENSNFFSLQLILPLFLDCEVTGYVLGLKSCFCIS